MERKAGVCVSVTAGRDKQHLARAKLSNASRCRDQVSRQETRRRWWGVCGGVNSGEQDERRGGGGRKKMTSLRFCWFLNVVRTPPRTSQNNQAGRNQLKLKATDF